MSHVPYSLPLRGPDSIRLLRLIPDKDEVAPIQCQLFNYSLQETGKGTHLYEALSYVWGPPDKVLPIYVAEHRFNVTENLYAVLLRLRDRSFERIIWVDAICINQADVKEKERQIQSMAKIYSQANRVIVWLGEAKDDSDQAFEAIRSVAEDESTNVSTNQHKAVLALLQRSWFGRIWVSR